MSTNIFRKYIDIINEANSPKTTWAVFNAKNFAFDREYGNENLAKNRVASYERDGEPAGTMTYAPMAEFEKISMEYHINRVYDDWMNSEFAPLTSDAGDDNEVIRKASEYLDKTPISKHKVDYPFREKWAGLLANKYHGM
jgi:hypothetical protein